MDLETMPDEMAVTVYGMTIKQLEIEDTILELIDKYGCLHKEYDNDFCKKRHQEQRERFIDTLHYMWHAKSGILEAVGYNAY
mgnify:FL=1